MEDKVWEVLPLSRLKLLGKFSLSDAHNWISNCLPDVPHNVASEEIDDTQHTYWFRSTFVGTYLMV